MAKKKSQRKNASFNTLAIIAFCVALVPIWGLAGPVLGIIALTQIKKTGERGKGLAITAIVLPLVALLLFIAGVVFFVVWANNNVEKEAAKLGVDRQTYSAVKEAVDTNCRTINLTENNTDFDGVPYGYKSLSIERIDGDFAVGTRTCTTSVNEQFIAKKDIRWKVVSVGETPLCSDVVFYKIPVDLSPSCLDSNGNLVTSPAAAV